MFIAADQHFAASHQHRDGVREFQAGPIATTIGNGRPFPDPEVVWRGHQRNYGLLRIDTAANPRTMTVEWRGLGGLIRREVFPAFVPARLSVGSDAPECGV